jgi:predicted cupin superfamily sugar epimerase
MQADEIIAVLDLKPHPEGGHFRETFRDVPDANGRAFSTAIYYLLKAGERSHWHRVDAVETWHWHAGHPLALRLSKDGRATERLALGSDLAKGERPQIIVPKGCWQAAEPLGAFTLVSCTVAPGFHFAGFELAPANWRPAN